MLTLPAPRDIRELVADARSWKNRSRIIAKNSDPLLDTSRRSNGNESSEFIGPSILEINWNCDGLRMLANKVFISAVACRPKARTACAVTPRSWEKSVLARTLSESSISIDSVRASSSKMALVGIPPPWRRTSESNVGPDPKILRSAGCPFEFVYFGS